MKSVVITGAYGGMGSATRKLFADNGFRVFALDKKVDKAEENVIPVQTDITDEENVKIAYDKVKSETDEIYAIIHFAGVYMLDSLVEMAQKKFERIFEINLFGAFCVNKTFLPLLKNGSKILITTSELAPLNPLPFTGVYAVSKSALDKYAYSLRMELQLIGVSVSVLRAGAVSTGMLGESTAALDCFCENTELYTCNADRFKKIVDSVESKCVTPNKIAEKVFKILKVKNPKFAYTINRNKLLLLLNVLPKKFQFFIIKKILK